MTNLEITNAYIGSDQISKLYLGGEAVWPTTPPPPEPVYSAMPLTFEIISGGTIVWYSQTSFKLIQYRINDDPDWTNIQSSTEASITVETGDKVQFRAYNNSYGGSSDAESSSFIGSGDTASTAIFEVYGNIMSLIGLLNYEGLQLTTANTACFKGLFNHFGGSPENTSLVSAEHLIFPNNTVKDCYRGMFIRNRGLRIAPELPATELAENCYLYMFQDCTGLTTAPTIIPATVFAKNCCKSMFNRCSGLITGPSSVGTSATTMSSGSCSNMFDGCTSLTTAPELPATTLVYDCYSRMFTGCTNLNYIRCLATNISYHSTTNWVSGVAASGTFVKDANAAWTTGTNGIPDNWTVEDAVITNNE